MSEGPGRARVEWIAGLGAALVLVTVVCLAVGSVRVPLSEVAAALFGGAADPQNLAIVRDLRLPRVLLALFVGASLGVSGAAFQGLFRNALADPFVIGASSGAALGATLAIVLGFSATAAGLGPVPLAAFIGSLGAVGIAHFLAFSGGARSVPAVSLLLAGTAISTFLGACVSLSLYLDARNTGVVLGWLLGSLSGRGWHELYSAVPYMLTGMAGIWLSSRPLDALGLGEEAAAGLGLPLLRFRVLLLAAASLATGAAVASAGVIGFVGLVAPHAARLLVGARHAVLIPASALTGAILLTASDAVARTIAAPVEIPAGIVTALVGGPFFLYLLRSRRSGLGSVR